ncbi:MAG TPA: ATP-binding protein [Candidatus Baltobacteraceae bacterium]|nr:ATP-binding protein [Candidatus Baltobacteraceae bacterium]
MSDAEAGATRVLLIADRKSVWADAVTVSLKQAGVAAIVQDLDGALECVGAEAFLFALCGEPEREWGAVVSQLREAAPNLRVVLAGPAGDVRLAVRALRLQPFDYVELPLTAAALQDTLVRAEWEPDPRQGRWLEALQVLSPGLIHELRNPLSGVLAGSQLLGRLLQAGGGPTSEYLQIVREEAQQLERHLTRLAEFGRLGAHGWGLTAEVDLQDVVRRVVERQRADCEARGVSVVVEPDHAVTVRGDSTRLAQALTELLRNALEALSAGGCVTCRLRVADGASPGAWAEVLLSDSGPGLSGDAHRRAFEPFYSTKPRALGIGLPLAQTIALRHQGTIRLESGFAGGTTAVLRLPAVSAD